MKQIRRILLAFLASLSVLLQAADPLTPMTMQLDWKPNVQFAGILVALDRGFYRDAGIDLTLRPVDLEMKVVDAIVSGTNWIGCSESGVLLGARAHGAPIKAVGTMIQGSPFCLMSLAQKQIVKPANLRGQTLGVHPDANLALDVILHSSRIPRSTMKCIDVEHSIQPLVNGQIDVLMGYIIDEAVALQTAGHSINIIPAYEHGYVAYSQVYFTSDALLKSDPALVGRFLEASYRGWTEAARDPEAVVRLVTTRFLPGVDPEYQRRSLTEILKLTQLESGNGSFGTMKKPTWKKMVRSFNDSGVLARRITVDEITDFRFQPQPSKARRKEGN
jgi:ABC-type nitrate/sulfonate/bicarbonate transport system substrate-binding protein